MTRHETPNAETTQLGEYGSCHEARLSCTVTAERVQAKEHARGARNAQTSTSPPGTGTQGQNTDRAGAEQGQNKDMETREDVHPTRRDFCVP